MPSQKVRMILALLLVSGLVLSAYWPRTIDAQSLSRQLAGEHCRFAINYDSRRCEQRGFDPLRSLFTEDHDCDLWAVQCLAERKSSATVDVMVKVLTTKTDVQTCDGVRPIRTTAVTYLGNSGDVRALRPLKALLARKPKQTLSGGASGCQPAAEDTRPIRRAIEQLEKLQSSG